MTRWLSRWLIRAADAITRDPDLRAWALYAKLTVLRAENRQLRAELADRRQAIYGRLLAVRTGDGKLWHPADVQHVYPGEVDRP